MLMKIIWGRFQRIIKLFNQKLSLIPKKNMGLGSRIRDPRSVILKKKPIPDPGSGSRGQKRYQIPDPGSATLIFLKTVFNPIIRTPKQHLATKIVK
jgi:hypothetical protein